MRNSFHSHTLECFFLLYHSDVQTNTLIKNMTCFLTIYSYLTCYGALNCIILHLYVTAAINSCLFTSLYFCFSLLQLIRHTKKFLVISLQNTTFLSLDQYT